MRFLLSKLRIFLFFPIPYLSQPLFILVNYRSLRKINIFLQTGFTRSACFIPFSPGFQYGIGYPTQLTVHFTERPVRAGLNDRDFLPLAQSQPTACAVKTMGLPLDHPQRAAGDFQQALRCSRSY